MTGQDKAPVEINCVGVVIQRRDIATTHIEADNIIGSRTSCCNLGAQTCNCSCR